VFRFRRYYRHQTIDVDKSITLSGVCANIPNNMFLVLSRVKLQL